MTRRFGDIGDGMTFPPSYFRGPPDGPPHDEAGELSPEEVAYLRSVDDAIAAEAAGWVDGAVVVGGLLSERAA